MFGKGKISIGKINFNVNCKKLPDTNVSESASEIVNVLQIGEFGKFSSSKILSKETGSGTSEDSNLENEGEFSVSKSMGFSSFGKSARVFDLEKIAEQTKKAAYERNRERLENLKLEAKSLENVCDVIISPSLESDPRKSDENSSDEDELFGPPLPSEMINAKNDSDEESDDEDIAKLPLSHELTFTHGTKTVSALTVDPSGSRLVSGGIDYEIKYWDFQGIDLAKEAFRSFKPADGYPINSVDYSCTGDKVLVVSGSSQGKVYDRDGVEVYECAKGDMYLRDMAETKGHIHGLTNGKWHPKNKEEFLTAGRDGTCRVWYTSRPLGQIHVLKPRASTGLKTNPTTCSFSRDGLLVACACDDGSIQMWDHRKNFVNTSFLVRNAHSKGTDTSCLTFSYDNKAFVTRGGDQTLKLWDIRNSKVPLIAVDNLFSRFPMTDCLFSPNDKMIMTGTSMDSGDKAGKLKYFDRNTGDLIKEMDIGTSHVVKIIWHPRLNQIMLGCGDGQIRIFYDPKLSRNGAIFVAGKNKKRVKPTEVVQLQQVITPHALPLFREERHRSSRKTEEKDRKNPTRSHQPELPLGKAGSGGRVSTGGSTLSSYIIRNMGIRNKVREEEDPREALLRHAKEAKDNPYWIAPAYSKTQPKPIFQQPEAEDGNPTKKQKKVE